MRKSQPRTDRLDVEANDAAEQVVLADAQTSAPLPPSDGGDMTRAFDAGPIERLNMVLLLKESATRLAALESALSAKPRPPSVLQAVLELGKALLGGWHAFGFLFLILFYAPLRDALSSIPDKVRTADEIHIAGVSLKSTIQTVAASEGLTGLAETIPQLSGDAIQMLMSVPPTGDTLVSKSIDTRGVYALGVPSARAVSAAAELAEHGLIKAEGGIGDEAMRVLGDGEIEGLLKNIERTLPGSTRSTSDWAREEWHLEKPLEMHGAPLVRIFLHRTRAGIQAADVLVKAVSASLSQATAVPPGPRQ